MPKFTVAIAGGGLCGLVFALALDKFAPDVDYHIYESAAELTTAGAGIGFQPRTLFVLRELGLEPALLKISGNGTRNHMTILYRKSDQPQEGFTFNETDQSEQQTTFHRGELQKVFLDHIRHPERIHLGKRVVSYTQSQGPSGEIRLHFRDGTEASCDVLVGADGIKSGVRTAMFTQLADAAQAAGRAEEAQTLRTYGQAIYSGTSIYRGLINFEDLRDGQTQALNRSHVMIYSGKNRHVVAYPISQGRFLNVAAVVTHPGLYGTLYKDAWRAEVSKEEVRKEYIGFEPEVESIMQNMATWSKWAVNVAHKLPTFVDGRVTLIGDAAHGMTPHQGAGAGQGFEDCLMLGLLLGQPTVTKESVPTALNIYDQLRRPVAQEVAALSLQTGALHSLVDPELEAVTSVGGSITEEHLARLAEKIERQKDWRRGTTVMQDARTALKLLQEKLSGTSPLTSNL